MKKLIIICFILCLLSIASAFIPKPAHAQPRPRFEQLLTEDADVGVFRVYHDKETGQEIVCYYAAVYDGYSASCWPTGRNWK